MAYMEVLLCEDVDNLGHRGQLVRVRAGYGRNYLLPRGLAIEATAGNKKMIEEQQQLLARREARERANADRMASELDGLQLRFWRRASEHGVLYGSVTALDIAAQLKERGYEIDRRKINLREPIKEVGDYQVQVKLHREITPTINVQVLREDAEEAAQDVHTDS
jgi:large subunit ribosomal protein L9